MAADKRASESPSAGVNALLRVEERMEMLAGAAAVIEVPREAHYGDPNDLLAHRVSSFRRFVHLQPTDNYGAQPDYRQAVRGAFWRGDDYGRGSSARVEMHHQLPNSLVLYQRPAAGQRRRHRPFDEYDFGAQCTMGRQYGNVADPS